MSFDTTVYLVIGILLAVLLGAILYLRPPGWRLFSGLELAFILFALMGCLAPGTFVSLLTREGVWLLLATSSLLLAMSRRKKVQDLENPIKSPTTTPQFRWLAVAYCAVIARMMLSPFLTHMF